MKHPGSGPGTPEQNCDRDGDDDLDHGHDDVNVNEDDDLGHEVEGGG